MLTVQQARTKAEALVEQAVRAGADGADALYLGELSSGVQVRKGDLEDVHRSESEGLGLRVFRGTRSASVSSSDLSRRCAVDPGRARAGDGRRSARG